MKRVAVTGIGVVSPLGNDLEVFCNRLLQGDSAAAPIKLFDAASLPTRIAAQVNADSLPVQTKDRKIAFGILAARSALSSANQTGDPVRSYYAASCGGLSIGLGLELFSMPDMIQLLETGDGESSLDFLQTPSDICAHLISREHDLRAAPLIHISACSASTDAIGTAFRMIREGRRSWMLVGGTDSMINPMGVGGFCRIEAMTRRNSEPQKASRPFDRDRDGFLLGEGAAMLVMEPWDHAVIRGATIYAEVLGYGTSFDAYGISEPHPEGDGAFLAMQRALKDGGVQPEEITYINAHGTSTPKNDIVETKAIRRVLGKHAEAIPVSSTKSMLGHLISAAGAVELAAALVCAQKGWVHPTINLENPDPACDLDYVHEGARQIHVSAFLKNSFAFGGQNASLLVRNCNP